MGISSIYRFEISRTIQIYQKFNMLFAIVVVSCLMASAFAVPAGPPLHPGPVKYDKKPYAYTYGVKDEYHGVNFGEDVGSDGNLVTGTYHVLLPDGRVQTVKYTADHYAGYIADVSYAGVPHYGPAPKPHHKPIPHHAPIHAPIHAPLHGPILG